MQLQNELVADSVPRLSVIGMSRHIYTTEGPTAFFTALPAAVLRQSTYGGLSFASYPKIRDALNPNASAADAPLWTRIASGAFSGAWASAIANPTDVVKVRLQADGRLQAQGQPPRYKGTLDAFSSVARKEGIAAFWRGTLPNVQRATVVNGAGIAAYDHSKQVRKHCTWQARALHMCHMQETPLVRTDHVCPGASPAILIGGATCGGERVQGYVWWWHILRVHGWLSELLNLVRVGRPNHPRREGLALRTFRGSADGGRRHISGWLPIRCAKDAVDEPRGWEQAAVRGRLVVCRLGYRSCRRLLCALEGVASRLLPPGALQHAELYDHGGADGTARW